MPEFLIEIYAIAIGLCIGSFLNVCIYRIPTSKSIVWPSSSCPNCDHQIRFYENIPLVSYLLLGGRCRACKIRISPRYFIIELLTGLFAWSCYLKFGLAIETLLYFTFIAVLIIIIFIDIDFQIIPDIISLPGIPLFFIASIWIPSVSVSDSLLGILLGGGSLFIVASCYRLITGKEGMGGGDIKLLAMIGGLTGWQGVLFTIFISSFTGTLVGFLAMIHQGGSLKLKIPFGPFLSLGVISYIFFGRQLIGWYLRIF